MALRSAPPIPKSQPHTKRACLCSPTTHPGSFRCSLHKKKSPRTVPRSPSSTSHLLYSSMPAKPSSLKAFLLQLIEPSSHHHLHKRKAFHPKPTRFSFMNANNDAVAVS
ncbi:hypothetical protein ACSQ67_019909 [Phaseolus vulgaris]